MTGGESNARGLLVARGAAMTLLCLATAVWLTFAWQYASDRDPYLGYSSDSELDRTFTWMVLPGLTWAMAAMVTGVVWLIGSRALAAVAVVFCLVAMVALSWLPVGVALRHTF